MKAVVLKPKQRDEIDRVIEGGRWRCGIFVGGKCDVIGKLYSSYTRDKDYLRYEWNFPTISARCRPKLCTEYVIECDITFDLLFYK